MAAKKAVFILLGLFAVVALSGCYMLQQPCTNTIDCPIDKVCSGGYCVPITTTSIANGTTSTTTSGITTTTLNMVAAKTACTTDTDCPPNQYCAKVPGEDYSVCMAAG